MPKISLEVIRWARESAGLSVADAAQSIIKGPNAAKRLDEMEAGRLEPTRAHLLAMAKAYHRPLLTFYLDAPPEQVSRAHDFRTSPQRGGSSEGLLDALVRDVRARQSLVRAVLEEADDAKPLAFVNSIKTKSAEVLASAIIATWKIDISAFRATRTTDDSFKLLRDTVEASGVYVVLQGNLGHFTSNIRPNDFRGFVIADPIAPFIVINETDAKSAWAFTLVHELGHVLLGQSGISGYDGDAEVELQCDRAAALVLLGTDPLAPPQVSDAGASAVVAWINMVAAARKVSRKMVAYNLLLRGQLPAPIYGMLSKRFDDERDEAKAAAPSTGSGNYYTTRRHRVGPSLIRLVDRMVAEGRLTYVKAGRVLGVKPTSVNRMTSGVQAA